MMMPSHLLDTLLGNTLQLAVQRAAIALPGMTLSDRHQLRARLRDDVGGQVIDLLGVTHRQDGERSLFTVEGYVITQDHLRHMLNTAYEAGATGHYERSANQ